MEVKILEFDGIKYTIKIYYEKRNNCTATIRKTAINIRIPPVLNSKQRSKELTKLNKIFFNPNFGV